MNYLHQGLTLSIDDVHQVLDQGWQLTLRKDAENGLYFCELNRAGIRERVGAQTLRGAFSATVLRLRGRYQSFGKLLECEWVREAERP